MIYDLESTSFFVTGTQRKQGWAMDRSGLWTGLVSKAWEGKIDVLYYGSKDNVLCSLAQGEPP